MKKIKKPRVKEEKKSNLQILKEECVKNLEGWQRAKADYENLKKRSAEDKIRMAQFANADLLLGLISVVDNFQSAYGSVPKELEGNNWVEGIRFIKEQMEKFLADNDLVMIEAIGQKFDPEIHEALESVESDSAEGMVVEEVMRGYTFNGKTLRPARVRVSSGKTKG